MRRSKGMLMADLALLALLVLSFVGIVFMAIDAEYIVPNSLGLTATVVVLVVTYFTTLGIGLLANVVALLVFIAYNVLTYLPTGQTPPIGIYFWLVWMPLMTVSMHLFTRATRILMRDNEAMQDKLDRFVTIDPATGLKNLRGFVLDAPIAMRRAKRPGTTLSLLLWTLDHQDELAQFLKDEELQDRVVAISAALDAAVAEPGLLYIVGDRPFTWVYFLMEEGDTSGTESVAELASKTRHPIQQPTHAITVTMHAYTYEQDDITSFALLDRGRDAPVVAGGDELGGS